MVYMLVGIQGSGKSTFALKLAKEKNINIVSTDQVRKDNPGIDEKEVWPTVYKLINEASTKGVDVIYDATSITKKVRKRFFDEVQKYGSKPAVGVYNFITPPSECERRVIERNKIEGELYLPIEVIWSYAKTKEEPEIEEGFEFVKNVLDGKIIENNNR